MNFDAIFKRVTEKLVSWLQTFFVMLPNLVVALLVGVAFWLLSRLFRRLLERLLTRTHLQKPARDLMGSVAQFVVIVAGIMIALSVLNLDKAATSMLAGAGIAGIALGFALQNIAANFMSGIVLSVHHPFKIGDLIETNDMQGIVEEVELRTTRLRTLDGKILLLPNKDVFEKPITNLTQTGLRRVEITCGVSYTDDLEKVRKVTLEALEPIDPRDHSHAIEFFYEKFNESSIDFIARFWIPFKSQADYLRARSDAVVRIKKAFDENEITIPFPIRTLDFDPRVVEAISRPTS